MPIIICLDLGIAHTGIAISREGELSEPLATIYEASQSKIPEKLLPFITKNSPNTIVIGIPSHGPLVDAAKNLKNELQKVFPGEIILFSEDYSSKNARSVMKMTGKTLAERKSDEHQVAAALILQEYLDVL